MSSKTKLRNLKAREQREWLIESIQRFLLPVIIKRGFETVPLVHRGTGDPEFVSGFPSWGRLIRIRESGVDLIEIQFASHGRAAFRINAGIAPKDGLKTRKGYRPAKEVAVHWLDDYFETHARPWLKARLESSWLGASWRVVFSATLAAPVTHER